MGRLELQPLTLAEACAFIEEHHRHHIPPVGHRFSIGVNDGERVVGVITIGRPVARHLDKPYVAEATRCCTDGTKNVASMLYSAAWRACKAMGYKRLVTYVLEEETGTSLKAAGWKCVASSPGGSWSCNSRPRVDKHPLQAKFRWEAA